MQPPSYVTILPAVGSPFRPDYVQLEPNLGPINAVT